MLVGYNNRKLRVYLYGKKSRAVTKIFSTQNYIEANCSRLTFPAFHIIQGPRLQTGILKHAYSRIE